MADIGQSLHEARIRARIDISEMEARTKIRAKYLRALENEEWDLLPGDVFVKSFLKTYADALGLDSRLLVDEFKRRYDRPMDHEVRPAASIGGRDRDRSPRAPREPHAPRGPILSPRALVVLVIVVIVVGLGVYGELSGGKSPSGGAAHTGVATKTHTHATTTPTSTSTTTTATTAVKATVSIVPTASVWICVERPGGKVVIPGVIYDAGQTVPVASGRTLLLNLGNADVNLTVNGKPYSLSSAAVPVGLKVTATGVSTISPGPNCGQ